MSLNIMSHICVVFHLFFFEFYTLCCYVKSVILYLQFVFSQKQFKPDNNNNTCISDGHRTNIILCYYSC